MKGLVLCTITSLFIASIGCSYADAIRVTVVNESAVPIKLIMSSNNQQVPVGFAAVKMFTSQYTYPAKIMIQSLGKFPEPCNWSMAPVGKQSIKAITLNISNNRLTNNQSCLISWQ